MSIKVRIKACHKCDAQNLWDINCNWQYFEKFTQDYVRFKNLPNGNMFKGQNINIEVSMFGITPFKPWQINFIEFDPNNYYFETLENGAGIKKWHHISRIIDTKNGVVLIDEIEIDAGFASWLFAIWALIYYSGRKNPRQKIIDNLLIIK
jgi:ligand-binding SRPBCC domain-containing protein